MRSRPFLALAAALLLGPACATTSNENATPAGTQTSSTARAEPGAGGLPANTTRIQVVALSDFHGWLLPLEPRGYPRYFGGIANLGGQLKHRENLRPETSLILDNGDMWTGPTEATFLRGSSVIEAYNALGVAAANIANHEFDFGLDVLRARGKEAKFPFLGANIVKAGTRESPDFVRPWVVIERGGVRIGVIGLSYLETPKTTHPRHVEELEFLDYAETLRRTVPEARKAGADVVVVLFHDELAVARRVLESLPEVRIDAVVAGQNHRKEETRVRDTPVVNPGPFGRSYVRFDIDFDTKARKVLAVANETVDVVGEVGAPAYQPAPELIAVADAAKRRALALADEVAGRLAKPLPVGTFQDSPLGHFVVDSWLAALPDVDVAMCNHGGLRQPLPAGPIRLGDVLGVLPFENNLYVVRITGKQLKAQLTIDAPVVGGITWTYRQEPDGTRQVVSVVDRLGKPIDDHKKYSVAINDFMYLGGDGFQFRELDPRPDDTGLSWRQPVIKALRLAEATGRLSEPRSGARAREVK